MTDGSESGTSAGRRSKVARLLDEYEFEGLGAELEHRWTTDGRDGMSLRELETYFNERLLEHRMRSVGIQSLEGEVPNIYRLLTGEDVSSGGRTRVKRRLERAGVDVEALQEDFVSYQAIRTYLKEYRGTVYESEEGDPRESAKRLIAQMRNRTSAIAENKLDQLAELEDFHLEDPQVFVDVQVICGRCSTQQPIQDALEDGGCDCGVE
ncbi:rod-determining factor RdfA [Halobacterium bonnevillei]|uniref:Uncharacterized protein n=1 Tax=Halobacterium bonnevillei TaxID=2692200 RepID=A0A6B0SE77_9EURY|nr:rod-determining factor RdfA [Halobacterium bonnevillei]MXR20035.1 hypothetical protein [Halobacterium bonnevillei]